MNDRELVLDLVKKMPKTASLRQIADELLIMGTLRERTERNPHGLGIDAEELLKQVSSWVKA
jgi:hypothetical protein